MACRDARPRSGSPGYTGRSHWGGLRSPSACRTATASLHFPRSPDSTDQRVRRFSEFAVDLARRKVRRVEQYLQATPAGVALSLESDFFDGSAELIASLVNSALNADQRRAPRRKRAKFAVRVHMRCPFNWPTLFRERGPRLPPPRRARGSVPRNPSPSGPR